MAAANLASGIDSTGIERPIKVGTDGTVATSGAGGTSDATAANQVLQITQETNTNTKLDTLHTDSAAILAKLLAAPATEAKQDTGNTSLNNLDTNTGAIADAAVAAGATGSISAKLRAISRDIIANIVLKAGSAIIGQVGVDQTTPGTTDSVTVKASAGIGSLTEGAPASDTASSGLNGRLQRIAQRLTSLLAGTPILPVTTAPVVTTVSANNADLVASMDVTNYRSGSLQLAFTGTATVQIQFSLDGGTTWVAARTINRAGVTASSLTAANIYDFPIPHGAAMRIRTTAYTSGNVSGALGLATVPIAPINVELANSSSVSATGNGAAAASDSGNPVKTGGKYNSTKPTYTDGQRGDTQIEINGATAVALYVQSTNPGDTPVTANNTDSVTGALKFQPLSSSGFRLATTNDTADANNGSRSLGMHHHGFNGTTWDRFRAVVASTVLASAARTATVSTDVTNYNGKTIAVTLNITVAPNTASTITVQIRLKDSISGNYTTLLASAAIVGTATTGVVPVTNLYRVGRGITVTANVSASDVLGRTLNVNVVHSNADSWTYSVSTDIGV